VAETIIALGRAFDMTTVAEGVETPEQFEMLEHLGCDQSQGYLHSRPLAAPDIEPLLKNGAVMAFHKSQTGKPELTPRALRG
jgi:EAL domain-containing protein (putative c-di-GMP-specific phosphodiesterase class I)